MTVTAPEFTDLEMDPIPGTEKLNGAVFAAGPARKPPMPDPDPVNAPNGWIYSNGQWRGKKLRGRPKAPRVIEGTASAAPPETKKAAPVKTKVDYRETIVDTAESVWAAAGVIPIPDKVFGYDLSATRVRLRASAMVLQASINEVATGVNTMGEHVPFVERRLAAMKEGKGGLWVIPCALLLAPFVASVAMVWAQPVTDELIAVAAKVEQDVQDYFKEQAAVATATAEQQQQELIEQS